LWLLILVGPLLLLQRLLHREIQAVFLLITRHAEISMLLFSLLFFPGILLHEGSHFLTAKLLGVRTGRLSLLPKVIPQEGNGKSARVQLGSVETSRADVFREALIGAAPLIFGGLFVTYAGLNRLHLHLIWADLVNNHLSLVAAAQQVYHQQDFWLWFYLIFVVSSTMLPSASDRTAWPSIGLIAGALIVAALIFGAGPWLALQLGGPFNLAMRALAAIFAISMATHLVFYLPLALLRRLLSKLTGLQVAG
jgi:hypothetical protein